MIIQSNHNAIKIKNNDRNGESTKSTPVFILSINTIIDKKVTG